MKRKHVHKNPTITLMLFGLILSGAHHIEAQSKPSYGQQIAVIKILQPDVKIIGVMGATLSEKDVQDITRAGLAQGMQIVVGLPQNPREISDIYKRLLNEKKIQVLWVPKGSDDMMMGIGFEYLRSTTLLDKIALYIPNPDLLPSGALCSVQMESGKLTVYVNQKIATLLGARVPAEQSESVTFVSR
ncbi:MAG TPA: hypothetical protein VMF88_02025 [Bacteroidota bacterium]|nr:hypothetical protein [Bacteroidota bacterium]